MPVITPLLDVVIAPPALTSPRTAAPDDTCTLLPADTSPWTTTFLPLTWTLPVWLPTSPTTASCTVTLPFA